jgi:alkylation response protein AidB-like acyl-CoA dehydrogenase
MDLSLDDTQQLIQESARDFVRNACNRDVLLRLDRNPSETMQVLWPKLAELGWTGMAIPEQYGGTGNSMTDVAVLFEELGTGPVPGPLLSSAVVAAQIVLQAASSAQKEVWLPAIASGKRIFALALTESQYGWTPESVRMPARREGSALVVSGTKVMVHDALFATDLLVPLRLDGAPGHTLLRIDAKARGVSIRALEGFLSGVCEVAFDNVRAAPDDLIGESGNAWNALDAALLRAVPVLCAYQVGGCRAVFEKSVEYSREREQFGQPIGRFQRVQDHVIQIVNYLDSARWTTYEALWKLDAAMDAEGSIRIAKAVSSESYLRACDFAHEVHAGIGVVREYGLTLHTKMSRTLYHCLGAPSVHRKHLERVLRLSPKN